MPNYLGQFGFDYNAVNLNFVCPEMREWLAPTDSRLRGDMRLYEEGKVDEADEEKMRLEVKQRAARKRRNDAGEVWVPNFFREIEHPYLPGQRWYEFIAENNYWDRRQRKDWEGLPELW